MLWNGIEYHDQAARYMDFMMDIVRGRSLVVLSFEELFKEEAHLHDRVNLRTSRMFFIEIVWYESYEKFDFSQPRLCSKRDGNHWDGHMDSIYLLRENNIKCWKCGFDLELYKLRFGLMLI